MQVVRTSLLLFSVVALLVASSCRKDMLHFSHVQQLNSQTTQRINRLLFLGTDVCVGAGGDTYNSSAIIRTTDGGTTWSSSSSSLAPKEMFGLTADRFSNIILCGIDGSVLKSSDFGSTWNFHRIENWLVYKAASFAYSDTGIFVSTVLQRQSNITRVDTGFHIIDEQTFSFGLNDIRMVSASTGYVSGYGVVMKTTDGGATWNFLPVDGDNFTGIFTSGNDVWVCGSAGSIFHSADAGANWSRLRNGNDISLPRIMLRAICFTDAQHGWACGDDGQVLYSSNGGQNWVQYDRFTTSSLRTIAPRTNGDILFAGDNGALYSVTP